MSDSRAVSWPILVPLRPLRQLKALEKLTLHHCNEGGDELLAQVPHLPAFKDLEIICVPVSDRGLERLHGLRQIKTARITGKGITPAGLAALRASLPEAKVND